MLSIESRDKNGDTLHIISFTDANVDKIIDFIHSVRKE